MEKALLVVYFCLAAEPTCDKFKQSGEAHFFLNTCSQTKAAIATLQKEKTLLFDRYEIKILSYRCFDDGVYNGLDFRPYSPN
jgi:hypothetical protein